jgi:hypothetical protein
MPAFFWQAHYCSDRRRRYSGSETDTIPTTKV